MDENKKKKLGKAVKYYAVGTQGVFTMALLGVLGFFIGYKINKDSLWPGVLAAVGILCGLFSFITCILYLLKEEEKKSECKK